MALVTGAGRRVGRAIALELGRAGAQVVVHYNASRGGADETAAMIVHAGGRAYVAQADLTDPAAPDRLIAEAIDAAGRLDILVNSAAVMERTPIGEVTVEAWEAMFSLNLRAPFFLSQAAAPRLAEGGVIVNIADLAAFETWPAYIPHSITKAGIVQLTRALARALAPRIRVNAVAPGAVQLPDDWDADSARRLASTTPLGRLGSADDVAQAVRYLIEAGYVTGEVLIVDGGRHVRV